MLLDELDRKLVGELEEDARQSVQELAKKMGINRTTVGYRLNRLISRGIVKIACVSNPEVLGFQFLLLLGINVSPGKVSSVADCLALVSEVKIISLTTGRFSILAWALIQDCSTLSCFVSDTLAEISDITSIEIMNSYHWVMDSWAYIKPKSAATAEKRHTGLTNLELSVIKAMQKNPRQTIAELSRIVGCSTQVAKTQLEKLLNDGIIKLVNIADSTALGYEIRVMILIKVKPVYVFSLAGELSMHSNIRHVSLITGSWQVFIEAEFFNSEHMQEYLAETLNSIPGIIEYEIIHLRKTLKLFTDFF